MASNYFNDNKIMNGTSIPTEGTFKVGDIIVNIGENAAEEPMWMCVEAGTPGVWKVVGAGEDYDTKLEELEARVEEAFQNANNGKELIANAIGEPVSKDDTFQAMSNDINGLLSTFKTNMMNNGVTVNSNDKFKSLIDKIATMVEEGSGKGIQMVSGTIADVNPTATSYTPIYGNSSSFRTVTLNLPFEPYMLLIENVHKDNIHVNRTLVIRNGNCADSYVLCGVMGDSWSGGMNAHMLKISTQLIGEVTLPAYFNTTTSVFRYDTSTPISWYAIGVGEEDTTLRDSLSSILQEEGVSVSNEDDMASLISKVNQEFDRQVVPTGTAVATNVLSGKTFINSTGQVVTGTMTNQGSKTVTPSASNQTLPAGYYSGITVSGDADLIAANIVAGKNIFGVNGNATAASLGGMNFATGVSAPMKFHSGLYGVKITGLSFKPSLVLVVGETEYYYGYVVNINGFQKAACASTNSYNGFTYKDNPSDTDNYMGCYDDGFKVGVLGGSVFSNFRWYAFG